MNGWWNEILRGERSRPRRPCPSKDAITDQVLNVYEPPDEIEGMKDAGVRLVCHQPDISKSVRQLKCTIAKLKHARTRLSFAT